MFRLSAGRNLLCRCSPTRFSDFQEECKVPIGRVFLLQGLWHGQARLVSNGTSIIGSVPARKPLYNCTAVFGQLQYAGLELNGYYLYTNQTKKARVDTSG